MKENGERGRISGEDGDFANAAVEGLGDCVAVWLASSPRITRTLLGLTLVGALLGLSEVRRLLHEVEQLLGQGGIGQRPSCRGNLVSGLVEAGIARVEDGLPAEGASDIVIGVAGSPEERSLPKEKLWSVRKV